MRNQYGGYCYRCGEYVAPKEGHFEKFSRKHRVRHPNAPRFIKWVVQHADCAITHRGTDKSIWGAP